MARLKAEQKPFVTTEETCELCSQLLDAIRGHQAHIDFEAAVKDFPAEFRGVKPSGAPHSPWQLVEHLRIAQHDILEFSRNPEYKSPTWPEGYWPDSDAPPDDNAWSKSVKAFERDAKEFAALVKGGMSNLFAPFKHGDGQTLLREALLVASHNSYHLGQLVFLKKILLSR